ncbi:efflux RND transporter periplasmic adaptor subunit [Chitinophaga sp.]|uniref:efflux RND transporter periplasmic adaptor subunit n=1 Tax=Chitinophaga sp. TaxID=1869181 RepID=UPI002CFDCADF|nr:efflux RND transporter periplasmic adaptor subunit [Chitinophaga sp.]HWV67520.1 efflux RND transporter periplasmic adaptor subunit [Chitinophaga sp.]
MKHRLSVSLLMFGLFMWGIIITEGCRRKNENEQAEQSMPVKADLISLYPDEAVIEQSYPANLQATDNIQLRPQVSGYIQKVYVDEGAFVKAGQPLFKINSNLYQEQKNTALAALGMAKAQLGLAKLELDKYKALTDSRVVSDFQYKKAKASYENAVSAVNQQRALVASANLNLDFSIVKAPVSGYIGRIPNRVGALVGPNDAQALAMLSQVNKIYVYFSLPEKEILHINATRSGKTLIEKLKGFQDISLLLADGKPYGYTGKIDMMDGQFDQSTGSVSLRASFPNPEGLLRTGNTGRILLKTTQQNVYKIPLLATYEVQDKIFVGLVNRQNKVTRIALKDFTRSGNFYLLKSGFAPGDRIIANELASIAENATITPKAVQ